MLLQWWCSSAVCSLYRWPGPHAPHTFHSRTACTEMCRFARQTLRSRERMSVSSLPCHVISDSATVVPRLPCCAATVDRSAHMTESHDTAQLCVHQISTEPIRFYRNRSDLTILHNCVSIKISTTSPPSNPHPTAIEKLFSCPSGHLSWCPSNPLSFLPLPSPSDSPAVLPSLSSYFLSLSPALHCPIATFLHVRITFLHVHITFMQDVRDA